MSTEINILNRVYNFFTWYAVPKLTIRLKTAFRLQDRTVPIYDQNNLIKGHKFKL